MRGTHMAAALREFMGFQKLLFSNAVGPLGGPRRLLSRFRKAAPILLRERRVMFSRNSFLGILE